VSELNAPCSFGGKLKAAEYYTQIASIVGVLRPMSSLRAIANHLNANGFKTPSNLEWNRDRLANHIRTTN
jgi:hypothetical protein